MRITGIKALNSCLPCGGREYCVARITNSEGDIPEELQQMIYPEGKERLTDAEGIPETSPWSKLGAAYIFVERTSITQEGYQNFRLMDSIDDFISPFEFEEPLKSQFVDYCFVTRAQQADVTMIEFDLDDEDDNGNPIVKNSFLFISVAEKSYILSKDVNEVDALIMGLERERFAAAKQDGGIGMLFAHIMEKGVNIYNDINYQQKAEDIANQISNIIYINELGEKSHLNITAVENLLSNIKDKIRISAPIVPRTIPIEPAVESADELGTDEVSPN